MDKKEISNLDSYKEDLERLISSGFLLHQAMKYQFNTEEYVDFLKGQFKSETKMNEILENLPNFLKEYQTWYSECLVLIKQLLPDRINDFVKLYEKPKTNRKEITCENYVIEDALYGLTTTRSYDEKVLVGPKDAIPRFYQQLNIVKSVQKRFESSLFDIKQLVQADIFDSELTSARELSKKGFTRAAGALAGVVLEGHLQQVCENHNIIIPKKRKGINELALLLKEVDVIETSRWRNIQHLADIRNVCNHKDEKDPTREGVKKLIDGVSEITKTLF